MYRIRSRVQQTLDLIEKYINILDAISVSNCLIINDKLVEILHRRFFYEYNQLTGINLLTDILSNEFNLQLLKCCKLICYNEPISLDYSLDTLSYFIEYSSLYGYEMNQSTELLETFKSEVLQYDINANSYEEFLSSIKQEMDISELFSSTDFTGTLENIYTCAGEYCIDTEVYKNCMIPAARKCYRNHKKCKLFQKCFSYIEEISDFESETYYQCFETESAWYMVVYYGQYNPYDEGYFFQLPASMYLKRLYIDVALRELNQRYQFYSN